MGDLSRLLDSAEVAERLNVSIRMVRRLVQERRIGFVKVGRWVRFRPVDVEAFERTFSRPATRS